MLARQPSKWTKPETGQRVTHCSCALLPQLLRSGPSCELYCHAVCTWKLRNLPLSWFVHERIRLNLINLIIVKLLPKGQTIHTVCCKDDYFPKGKFKFYNSLCHSVYLVFPKSLFSIADLFAMRYLCVVCNENKCCDVTQSAADICVAWLVYVRTCCVSIATLNQNKLTQLLYLGHAQIITVCT